MITGSDVQLGTIGRYSKSAQYVRPSVAQLSCCFRTWVAIAIHKYAASYLFFVFMGYNTILLLRPVSLAGCVLNQLLGNTASGVPCDRVC